MNKPVDFFTISGMLLFKLLPGTKIEPVPFGILQPGTKVSLIGITGRNGKVTSAHRVDEWNPWVQYEGVMTLHCPNVQHESLCLIFKLPPGGLTDKDQKSLPYDVYIPYHVLNDKEIIRNTYTRSSSLRIFKAVFQQFETGTNISNL